MRCGTSALGQAPTVPEGASGHWCSTYDDGLQFIEEGGLRDWPMLEGIDSAFSFQYPLESASAGMRFLLAFGRLGER